MNYIGKYYQNNKKTKYGFLKTLKDIISNKYLGLTFPEKIGVLLSPYASLYYYNKLKYVFNVSRRDEVKNYSPDGQPIKNVESKMAIIAEEAANALNPIINDLFEMKIPKPIKSIMYAPSFKMSTVYGISKTMKSLDNMSYLTYNLFAKNKIDPSNVDYNKVSRFTFVASSIASNYIYSKVASAFFSNIYTGFRDFVNPKSFYNKEFKAYQRLVLYFKKK
jgi:hypothetical protein